jgi:hypothetical protein
MRLDLRIYVRSVTFLAIYVATDNYIQMKKMFYERLIQQLDQIKYWLNRYGCKDY